MVGPRRQMQPGSSLSRYADAAGDDDLSPLPTPPAWSSGNSASYHSRADPTPPASAAQAPVIPRPMFLGPGERASHRHSRRQRSPFRSSHSQDSRRDLLQSEASDSPRQLSAEGDSGAYTPTPSGRANHLSESWPNFLAFAKEEGEGEEERRRRHRILLDEETNVTTIALALGSERASSASGSEEQHYLPPRVRSAQSVLTSGNATRLPDRPDLTPPTHFPAHRAGQQHQHQPPGSIWNFLPQKYSPNLNLLRRVNDRAKRVEGFLFQLKVLAIFHLVIGLTMLALDWAQVLIQWEFTSSGRTKVLYVLRSFYPLYVGCLGCLCVAAGMNKKTATQLLLLCSTLLLSLALLAPAACPLTQSALEAIKFSENRHIRIAPTPPRPGDPFRLNDAAPPTPQSLGTLPTAAAQVGGGGGGGGGRQPVEVERERMAALEDLLSNSDIYEAMMADFYRRTAERRELLDSVQSLRIAFCLLGIAQLLLTLLTLATALKVAASHR